MPLGMPRRQLLHRRRPARAERGAAAVEMALVLPMLLLLVIGIVSYGYLLSFRQAMSQGASEGARAAAVSALPTSDQKIAQAVAGVNDSLGSYGVRCQLPTGMTVGTLVRGGLTVGSCGVATAPCVNQSLSSCVSVQVIYDYADHPLVPEFPRLGIVLPNTLSYIAVAQVG
jgi:Flp pilus assembly protein TadG